MLKADGTGRGLAGKRLEEYAARQMTGGAAKVKPAASPSRLLAESPDQSPRLVNPYDASADVSARARSYLHANCAQCHVEAGGGNAQMELEFNTPLDKTRLVDVRPVHDTFGIKGARLIAPGYPDRSVLLQRIAHRDKGHMPPLATRHVDRATVEMMREWITRLKVEDRGEKKAATE